VAIYAIYASLRIIVDMSAISVHGEDISFDEENEGDRGNENTSQSTSQSALTSSESEGDSTSDNNENDDLLLKTESKRRPSHSSVKL
jgi:hypothetical protein